MIKRFAKYFKEYFIFTKSEIRGTIALLIVIGVIILLRWLLPLYTGSYFNKVNDVEFIKADSIIAQSEKLAATVQKDTVHKQDSNMVEIPVVATHKKDNYYKKVDSAGQLFVFDPNTVKYDELIKLGFEPKVAATLIKYRNKGAHFWEPRDIKRVYGMTDDFYDKIKPYIIIKQ